LADDEASIRMLNTIILSRAGYHVEAAEDGAAAWDMLQLGNYDLLITDDHMPKMSGVELVEKMRAAGMVLPIILATGTLLEEDLTRYPLLQLAATLFKPYTAMEFLGTVKRVLPGPSQ
jgi:CheY-like chemotaxis protein